MTSPSFFKNLRNKQDTQRKAKLMTTPDFLDDIQTIDTQSYDDSPIGDGLLRIHWHNGEPKMKTPGSFFIDAERVSAAGIDAPSKPWVAVEKTFESGNSVEGFEATALRLMIIGTRQQDCIISTDGGIKSWLDERTPKDARPKDWSVYVEALCIVQGINVPVVWASKRIKTSMGIVASIIPTYKKDVLKEASKAAGKPLPPWSFWLPVRSARDAKGNPVYEKAGERNVTPPLLVLPENVSGKELWNTLYVGRALMTFGAELREQYTDWLNERHTNIVQAATPVRANRNEPVAYDESEDLPF